MDPAPRSDPPDASSTPIGIRETKPAAETLLGRALQLVKARKLTDARSLLGIPEDRVDDAGLVQAMMNLEEGLRLVANQRQPEAAGPFRQAASVINLSSDEESRFFVTLMGNFCEGSARLFAGDAVGAHQLLDVSAEAVQRLSFFDPKFETMALGAKAMSHLAMARFHMGVGDMVQIRTWLARADATYNQILERFDPDSPAGIAVGLETFGGRVEQAILFARLDMESLDLGAMHDRLESARAAYEFLERHRAALGAGVVSDVLAVICGLYAALGRTHHLMQTSFVHRRAFRREEVETVQHLAVELGRLRDKAVAAGQRGAGFLYTINELARVHQSLLRLGKVTPADFGRMGGIIALGALVLLMFTIHLTVRPEGWTAFLFFFGATTVALVVGFGYGALRFRSLLRQWSSVVQGGSPSDEAPATRAS